MFWNSENITQDSLERCLIALQNILPALHVTTTMKYVKLMSSTSKFCSLGEMVTCYIGTNSICSESAVQVERKRKVSNWIKEGFMYEIRSLCVCIRSRRTY